ncbi:hypothetical protein CHRYSEOSP005_00080 [Chryseobacterium sp. Alg-005]|uniref:hypothetical protein n=1 Tax=Chryseobacterium sp. Alg-005 TaxID=3159516 RepID=UPI003555B653
MKTVKLIAVGINFQVAEALAKQFELKCFHRELGFKMDGWYVTDDEIVFDMKGYAKAKAGNCPVTSEPFTALPRPTIKKYPLGGILSNEKVGFAEDFNEVGARMLEAIQSGIKKPEIGLMPEKIWQEQRLKSINEAIERYNKNQQIIPVEWIRERNELIEKIHGNKAAT